MPGWLLAAVFSPVVVLSGIGVFFWIKDKLAARRLKREKAIKQRMLDPFPGGHPQAPSQPWLPLQEYSPEFHDQMEAAPKSALKAVPPLPASHRRSSHRDDNPPPAA